MTYPTSHNAYSVAVGAASSISPIFIPRDPTSHDISYQLQQRWINTQTQAIWVLESFSVVNGVSTSVWRALAPIVLSTVDPTSANYLYPLGQPWLNTATNKYWILVNVTGTTATWDELTSSGGGAVLSFTMGTGTSPVVPDGSGNINLPNGNNITPTGGTNAITYNLTGTTNHAVQIGNASGSLTSISVGTSGQLLQSAGAANPGWTTATYPSTTIANDILYSSATNVVGQIATAANGVLITSNASVPSLLANSGTPGYVLTANSGAPPSWQAAGLSSFQVNIQIKTTTGNYTPSANLLYCIVEILGGGAAGGGSNATGAGQYSIGGGGSAGEYARGVFSLAQIQADAGWTGTVLPFTIGAGGTGVSAGTGGSGGNTSFGTSPLISSNGGAGATAGLQQAGGNYSIGIGGAGGSGGTGGSFRSRGANGFTGVIFSTAGAASDGMGASTLYGSGGIIFGAIAAAGYGAGGFGNTSANGTGALAGSNGAPGVIIITEYIS